MEPEYYRGYLIELNDNGYYEICFNNEIVEFVSYEEALDWIDSQLEEPKMHTYHVFYATKDRGYDEFIQAYSSKEAEAKVWNMHDDILYITGINLIEE